MDLIQSLGLEAKKPTGTITASAIADADVVTIDDGIVSAVTFEFDDESDAATGAVSLSNIPADGDKIVISDGLVAAKTFEFDRGVAATGTITINSLPADGETLTLDDGTNAATVFEFDEGTQATGSIELTDLPADGNTITIDDGVNDAVVFEFDGGVAATGSLALTDNPAEGELLTISDGTNDPRIFEFYTTGGVAEGHVAVLIGANKEATMATLITVINANAFNITATAADPADHTCTLANDGVGVLGNVAITTTADMTITGMAGGLDAGTGPVSGTNTPVAIGLNTTITMANLVEAINAAAGLSVTATPADPADATCTLTCDLFNDDTALSRVGANITVADFDNGKDPGAGTVDGTNTPIAIGATPAATMVNLIAAVNGVVAGLAITATATTPASASCTLANDAVGVSGNEDVTTDSAGIAVTGMSGGLDAGDGPITAGRIPVAAATSAAATMAALVVAINAAGFGVTAVPAEPADNTCTLVNGTDGTFGNVEITKVGATITVSGMSGGTDVGDNVTPGNTPVVIGATVPETLRNLCEAIARSGLCIVAKPYLYDGPTVVLEHTQTGTTGNVAISKTGAGITVTGMSGGLAQADVRSVIDNIAIIADNTEPA